MKLGRFLRRCAALGCMAAAAPLAAQVGERMLAVFDEAMKPSHRFDAADLKIRDFSFVDEDRMLLFTSSTENLPAEYTRAVSTRTESIGIPIAVVV
jgi:hypothetical protein